MTEALYELSSDGGLFQAVGKDLLSGPSCMQVGIVNERGAYTCKSPTSFDPQAAVPIGCLAKVLVMTLVGHAWANDGFDPYDSFKSVIPSSSRAWLAHLQRVDIESLLNHSHGMDASNVSEVTRIGNFIDLRGLFGMALDNPPLSKPRVFYSYSNFGSWVAAGLLEAAYSRTFAELVCQQYGATIGSAGRPCPATGYDVSLPMSEWLRILALHLGISLGSTYEGRVSAVLQQMLKWRAKAPGWALELGAQAAWKWYPGGFLGHNAYFADWAIGVRIHPASKVGIVATCKGQSSAHLLTRLFARLAPGSVVRDVPKLVEVGIPGSILGVYGNASLKVEVVTAAEGARECFLVLKRMRADRADKVEQITRLLPADKGRWLMERASAGFVWIQPILGRGKIPTHLWNTRELFKRIDG